MIYKGTNYTKKWILIYNLRKLLKMFDFRGNVVVLLNKNKLKIKNLLS